MLHRWSRLRSECTIVTTDTGRITPIARHALRIPLVVGVMRPESVCPASLRGRSAQNASRMGETVHGRCTRAQSVRQLASSLTLPAKEEFVFYHDKYLEYESKYSASTASNAELHDSLDHTSKQLKLFKALFGLSIVSTIVAILSLTFFFRA